MALYAFDGTWNSATLNDDVQQENETNVAMFAEAYTGSKFYLAGPGTRFGKVGQIIGGASGFGGHQRIKEAYNQLCRNWEAGDRVIDIVGFSRGAALALDFANQIEDAGIRRPNSKNVLEENPTIRFLGLWDVVGSFGVPFNVGPLQLQEVNLGHKLFIPDHVEFCFHAMAIDERRQTFRITRLMNAYEVWFRGVHSDVGGGNGNVGLSSIALRWMLRKAEAAGLPIEPTALPALANKIQPEAPLHPPKDFIPNEFRGFLKGDRFHYAVKARSNHHNPPGECAHEAEGDEPRAFRLADLPRRGAAATSQPVPGSRLEIERQILREVLAQSCWTSTGIQVKKGERYQITAPGEWIDKVHKCSPAGYESPNLVLKSFEAARRIAKAPWFCLIACVHPSPHLEFQHSDAANMLTDFFTESFSRSIKKLDAESQLVRVGAQGSIEIDRDGFLYLFPNDAPWAYDNNSGEVKATIQRVL